jgi:hypothetical protein
MNAAAWIALGGAIVVLITNLVVLTRYLAKLESAQREDRLRSEGVVDHMKAQIKGEMDVMRAERQALVENTNVKLGQLNVEINRLERRCGDLERIVGRSTNLRELQD